MALFPCDICRKRYVGAGNSAYIGWMAGSFSERKRLRLCPADLLHLVDLLSKHMVLVQRGDSLVGDDTVLPSECQFCHVEPSTITWFANVYERTREPTVWATVACARCHDNLSQTMLMAA